MVTVTLIMFLIGLVGIGGSIVYLLLNFLGKKDTKKGFKILGGFVVLVLLAFMLKPSAGDNKLNSSSSSSSSSSTSTSTTTDNKANETEKDKNTTNNSEPAASAVTLTDNAIKLTTDTLKRDTLVKDVAIIMSDDKKTIIIAIQVNAATNKDKAKDLIDTAVRQLGAFCGGKAPTKTYLGEVWEKYDGNIRVFSGDKNVIQDAYITKTTHKIRYSSN